MYYLREALPADAQSIAWLEEELFPENWMSECTILNELERGPTFVLAAHGGGIPAYAMTHWRDGVLDLLRLGVTETHQGYGLGCLLLHRVLLVPHKTCVLTVRSDNTRAIALYRREGFKLYGVTEQSLVLLRTS